MKRVNFFLCLLFAAVLAGCGDDDDSQEIIGGDDDQQETSGGDGSTTPSEMTKYLVTRIEREHNSPGHTCNSIVYFEYDDENRIVKQTIDEEGNGDSDNMLVYTFEYNDSGFTMSYSTSDGSYSESHNYTTNEYGYVTAFSIEEMEHSIITESHEGTLSYDSDNYLQQGTCLSNAESTDVAYWEDGNMVKVVNDFYGIGLSLNFIAEMEYGNSDYVNNTLLSIDLNWALAQSEWIGCFGFDMSSVQLFGFVGQRSRLLMTKEYDRAYGGDTYYEYSYEFDDLNRPTKAVVLEDGDEDDVQTYTITYMAD